MTTEKPQFDRDEIRWLFLLVKVHRDDKTAIGTKEYRAMSDRVMRKLEGMY